MSRPHFKSDPADPLITTRRAAVSFGVSLRTIQLWCNANRLPYLTTPGGHRRIRLSHVIELQRAHATTHGLVPLSGAVFPKLEDLVQQAVDERTTQIITYLHKMADTPTALPTRAFWCREIAGLIANGEYKKPV